MRSQNLMSPEKKPVGVIIEGSLNCFFLGFFLLLVFLVTYFKTTPADLARALALFQAKNAAATLTWRQFKTMNLIYIGLSIFFVLSGWGVLSRKIWARRATVYFSFAWIVLTALTALLNPALIGQVVPYAVYPGFLVWYFTKKNIEEYFGG